MKRAVFLSDLHCGSDVGLTPYPKYGYRSGNDEFYNELWSWFKRVAKSLQPIDVLVCNGDAIDGRQEKEACHGLLVIDRSKQADMATECLRQFKAKKHVIIAGTPYHTGVTEDFERRIADDLGGEFKVHPFIDIGGVKFDVRHFIGGSALPHTRHTAISRSRLQNLLQAERNQQPKADVIVRSHCHFHSFCGGTDWLAMTLPAIQGGGGRYGDKKCEGLTDVGLVSFDIEKGGYQWRLHEARFESTKAKLLRF